MFLEAFQVFLVVSKTPFFKEFTMNIYKAPVASGIAVFYKIK